MNVANDGRVTAEAQLQPIEDAEKLALIQQQTVLLLHAYKCLQRNSRCSRTGKKCSLPHCIDMKEVLAHIDDCQAGDNCTVPHCISSREIIIHWKSCTNKNDCSVCSPLKIQ